MFRTFSACKTSNKQSLHYESIPSVIYCITRLIFAEGKVKGRSQQGRNERETNYFRKFISASPTLWYNNFYLNQLPQRLEETPGHVGIFLNVGQMEDSLWSVKPLASLTGAIQNGNIKDLEFKSRIYNHLDHMAVAALSFTKGLQGVSVRRIEVEVPVINVVALTSRSQTVASSHR